MRSFIVAASIVAVATAQGSPAAPFPVGVGSPDGNAINTPTLNELVPAGKPYKITWQPTLKVGEQDCSKVTLVLLRGPGENIKPQEFIAQGVPNSGSFEWPAPATLEDDKTHYGIQLFCDGSNRYQYSTQFGVSNPNGPPPVTGTVTATASATGTGVPYPTATGNGTEPVPSTVSLQTGTMGNYGTYSPPPPLSTEEPVATSSSPPTLATSAAAPSYTAPGNSTTPSVPAQPSQTGAASSVKVGMGMLFGAVALVFAL